MSSGQICADTGNVHWGRTRQTRQGPRRPVQGSLYPCVPIFAKVRLVTTVACTAGNRQEDYRQREKETHYRRRKHWIVYRVLDRPCLHFCMILTLTSLGISIKRGIRILRSTNWPAAKLQMVGVRILYVCKRTTGVQRWVVTLVPKTRRIFVVGSENERVCEAMGIGVWNRLELIEICVIPDGVGPIHSLCVIVQYI